MPMTAGMIEVSTLVGKLVVQLIAPRQGYSAVQLVAPVGRDFGHEHIIRPILVESFYGNQRSSRRPRKTLHAVNQLLRSAMASKA